MTILQDWGVIPRRKLGQRGRTLFRHHEATLPFLLHDAHRHWRARHKAIRHDEAAQKRHNARWALVKRSFAARGIVLND